MARQSSTSSVVNKHLLTLLFQQLDKLVGLAMLIVATTVFSYYTIWTLLMVQPPTSLARLRAAQADFILALC